jgi:hypothetical protein
MPNKTLYIPPADESLWAAAQRVADRKKTSLYRVLTEALKNDLPRAASEPEPEDEWATFAADAA